MSSWTPLIYLISAVLFVVGIRNLSRVRSARRGNALAASGMLLAAIGALVEMESLHPTWILTGLLIGGTVGVLLALRVQMTAMPEMVAILNGFGGLASALVAGSYLFQKWIETGAAGRLAEEIGVSASASAMASMIIGGVTMGGSTIAFGKLSGTLRGKPILLPGRHFLHGLLALATIVAAGLLASTVEATVASAWIWGLLAASLLLGLLLVLPIGGADMPVVISLLNSLSGVAAAATGFVVNNLLLIIAGALVGASGLILTQIMCRAMNRSLTNVIVGGFGGADTSDADQEYTNVRSYGAEEVALVLDNADRVVFVPGYGLAVAQAQHAVRELADLLEARGTKVLHAIHPVAGRMPGHMNVLLAEADVPYEHLIEMERINPEFPQTDVVIVVGANDVVNPDADKPGSPIHGMPILEVSRAGVVVVIKRSLSPGFAGVKNPLFERENTMMVFADAKQALQEMISEFKQLAA